MMKKLAVVTINKPGIDSALKLKDEVDRFAGNYSITLFHKSIRDDLTLPNKRFDKIKSLFNDIWDEFDIILCFLSTGIVIRSIASLLNSKSSDPAVVSMSFDLTRVVPLLSGHLGGANEFCDDICRMVPGCVSFVSTATDQCNTISFDMYAKDRGFRIVNLGRLASVSNSLINEHTINVFSYRSILDDIKIYGKSQDNRNLNFIDINNYEIDDNYSENVVISPLMNVHSSVIDPLYIKIGKLNLGIGFHKNMDINILTNSLRLFLFEHNLRIEDLASISTYEKKKDDPAIVELSNRVSVPIKYYNDDDINNLNSDFSKSKAQKFFNIKGVSEPCAILGSQYKTCFLRKHVYYGSVTIACGF